MTRKIIRYLGPVVAVAAAFLLLGSPLRAADGGPGPSITSVNPILPQSSQTISISGTGFGRFRPYVGDSPFIRISNLSAKWNAGSSRDRPFDKIGLAVLSWSNTQIVLGGFRGAYGRGLWQLHPGDHLLIQVWNPQTRAGPAVYKMTIEQSALWQDNASSPSPHDGSGESGRVRSSRQARSGSPLCQSIRCTLSCISQMRGFLTDVAIRVARFECTP